MLVGICGFQGAGKDTFANLLIENYKYDKLSFASATKDIISIIFGWNRQLLEGDTVASREFRETIDIWWSQKLQIHNLTPRKMLQMIGTDLFRNYFDENIWIRTIEKQILSKFQQNPSANIVLSDCRFPNEIQLVQSLGGKIIYIKRNEPSWFNDYKNGLESSQANLLHPSETSWIRENFDYVVSNDFESIQEFHTEIIHLIELMNRQIDKSINQLIN